MNTLVIAIILVIILIFGCCYYCTYTFREGHTTLSPVNTKGTLWVWEDSQGGYISKLPDFNNSYKSDIVSHFDQVNLIAENKKFPSTTNKIWDDMLSKYATPDATNTKFWLSVYFGKDGYFGSCRDGSNNVTCQDAIKKYLTPYITNGMYKLEGIVIDKEGSGNPWDIMNEFCEKHNIKLVWGAGINSCGVPPGNEKFSACLGETYTTGSLIYNQANNCKMVEDFWNNVIAKTNKFPKDPKTVPLLCMTGNCIEKNYPSEKWSCNDNRVTTDELKKLVLKKPIGADLGLWYGAGLVETINGCSMTDIKKCNQGCCIWK
jgi:hypothetical protein